MEHVSTFMDSVNAYAYIFSVQPFFICPFLRTFVIATMQQSKKEEGEDFMKYPIGIQSFEVIRAQFKKLGNFVKMLIFAP